VQEWLDCGNYGSTVYTNQRILAIKHAGGDKLTEENVTVENSVIIEPCFIGSGVTIRNSVVGPHVSLEANCVVTDSRISNSIVGEGSTVKSICLENSMLGKSVTLKETPREWSLGDFSTSA
jgi:glucose-1-phosphate thymidylyltransferase